MWIQETTIVITRRNLSGKSYTTELEEDSRGSPKTLVAYTQEKRLVGSASEALEAYVAARILACLALLSPTPSSSTTPPARPPTTPEPLSLVTRYTQHKVCIIVYCLIACLKQSNLSSLIEYWQLPRDSCLWSNHRGGGSGRSPGCLCNSLLPGWLLLLVAKKVSLP